MIKHSNNSLSHRKGMCWFIQLIDDTLPQHKLPLLHAHNLYGQQTIYMYHIHFTVHILNQLNQNISRPVSTKTYRVFHKAFHINMLKILWAASRLLEHSISYYCMHGKHFHAIDTDKPSVNNRHVYNNSNELQTTESYESKKIS